MTDTYRNHLLQRVRGTPGGVPLPPVAQIASNAARETAAKIAVALRPANPVNDYNRFLGSRVIQPGTGPVQTPVQRSEYVPQNVPVGNPAEVTALPDRRAQPIPSPGAPGQTTGFNENSYNALFNAAYNQSHGVPQRLPDQVNGPTQDPLIVGSSVYKQMISAGATPEEAYTISERDFNSRTAEATRKETTGELAAAEGGLDPFGELVVSGGTKGVDYAKVGLETFEDVANTGRLYVQGQQAELVYKTVKGWREEGKSDREIIALLKSEANPLMANIPVGSNDSDADITAFFNGLITAFEQGYTAYNMPVEVPSYAAGSVPETEVKAVFDPGAGAAHEYIAGLGNILERSWGDIWLDPTNWALGPARRVGSVVAKAGEALATGSRAEEGIIAASKLATGRVIQGVGKVLEVSDVVLNQAADNLVGGTLGVVRDIAGQVPGVGRAVQYLGDTPVRIKARSAREDTADAYAIADKMESSTGVVDDIGGAAETPMSYPDLAVPALTAKSSVPEYIGTPYGTAIADQPYSSPNLAYPALTARSTYPDYRVGPGGQVEVTSPQTKATTTTPYTGEGVIDTEGIAAREAAESAQEEANRVLAAEASPDIPVHGTPKSRVRKVGDNNDVQVVRRNPDLDGNPTYDVQVKKNPNGKWDAANIKTETIRGEGAEQLAIDRARDIVRGGPAIPDTTPSVSDVQQPLKPTPTEPITERWSLKPKPGGMIAEAEKRYPTQYARARAELEPIARSYELAVDKKRGTQLPDTAMTPGSGTAFGYADDAIYGAEFYADIREALIRNGIPANDLPNIDRGGRKGNPTEQAVRQAIYEESDDVAKKARSSLYASGYMVPKPPRPGLRDDIINAQLPASTSGGTRYPNGHLDVDGVTYTNTGLSAMAPNIRAQLADRAIAEQAARYERSVRLGSARERLSTRSMQPPLDPVTVAAKQDIIAEMDARTASGEVGDEIVVSRRTAEVATSLGDAVERLDSYAAEAMTDARVALVQRIKDYFKEVWARHQRVYFMHPGLQRTMRGLNESRLSDPLPPSGSRPAASVSSYLPPDISEKLDYTRFAGLAEPLYTGMTVRQVRDQLIDQVAQLQVEAQRLTREVAAEKQVLGLGDAPLYKKGESARKTAKRPVVEVAREGPVRGRNKPLSPITSKEVIAKEKRLSEIIDEYGRFGDIMIDDPRKIANEAAAYQRELDINPDLGKRPNIALDFIDAVINRVPRHLLLADPFTSWGYSGRNIMGNIETSALGTQGESLGRVVESFRAAIKDSPPLATRISEDLGLITPRQLERKAATANDLVLRRGIDADANSGMGGNTPTRELAQKLHLDWVARAFDWKRHVDAGFEYSAKLEMAYSPMLQGHVVENMAALASELARMSKNRGVPMSRDEYLDLMMGIRKPDTGVFSYEDVATAVQDAVIARGATTEVAKTLAEAANRRWRGLSRRAQLDAIDQTNRIFPSYRRMTNADHYMTYLSLFHFWPTRTAKLVLEEMIRNPQLYIAWQRTHDGLARMAEEGGYPASVRMLMYIAESPMGFALYVNPISLFLVTALQPEHPDYPDPKGTTQLGHYLKQIQEKTGLSPTPFINAALNVMGVYGNSFPPNPWPSRTTELAGAAIDIALTQMGHEPGSPIYDNSMAWIRSRGSGILPGTSNVPYVDQGAYTEDLVGSKVLDNNQELAGRMAAVEMGEDGYYHPTADAIAAQAEFAAIMDDPSNPEHVKAMQQVALQNGFTKAINAFSPITIKSKLTTREIMIQASREGRESEQATAYQQGARNVRAAVTTTPEASVFDVQAERYQQLGTEQGRQGYALWNEIAYADDFDDQGWIELNGELIAGWTIKAMTDDQRERLADKWLAQYEGVPEEVDSYRVVRTKFLETTPEFGTFKEWQTNAYRYEGGIGQFMIDRAAGNPNFKRAMEDHRQFLLDNGVDKSMIDKEMEEWAGSLSAYKAAQGIQDSIYDPAPISTGDQPTVDTLLRSGAGVGSTKPATPKDPMTKLADDITAYQEKLTTALDAMKLAGYAVSEEDVYAMSPFYATLFKQFGVPTASADVMLFLQWAALPENQGRNSVDEFIAYLEELGQKAA